MRIDKLRSEYIFCEFEDDFSVGRRSTLHYACPFMRANFTKLNPEGYEPSQYLLFAKNDFEQSSDRGYLNSIGNAKKCIHLLIDKFLFLFCMDKVLRKSNFSQKMEFFEKINIFPTSMIRDLNQQRNIFEHEYKIADRQTALNFIELTEMFLMLSYPLIKNFVLGAIIGYKNDERCYIFESDPMNCSMIIREIRSNQSIQTEFGPVYYSIPTHQINNQKGIIEEIILTKSNQNNWITYLDIMAYLTKHKTINLPLPDERGFTFSIEVSNHRYFEEETGLVDEL